MPAHEPLWDDGTRQPDAYWADYERHFAKTRGMGPEAATSYAWARTMEERKRKEKPHG